MPSRKYFKNIKSKRLSIKSWCDDCTKLSPVLGQKVNSADQKWNLVSINVDHFPDVIEEYDVKYKFNFEHFIFSQR